MSSLHIAYLAILSVCILLSGFFSGSETALIGIPRERVHQLAGQDRRGDRLAALVADPDRLLSTLLVANNFVNILGASIATALFIDLTGETWGPWVATGVVTAVILIVGEIAPKTLAARYPEAYSLFVARPVWSLARVLAPFSRVFVAITRFIFRMFRLRIEPDTAAVTEDDIRALASLSERDGQIERAERDMIHALFSLADRPVRDVMTHRVDIVTLSPPVTIEDVRAAMAASGHSRFPVVGGGLDDIVGVLHFKDLMGMAGDPPPARIRSSLRTPYYVPESTPILAVLQEMRSRRIGFGVVVDEHGGVEGIITPKDLVAELVGELHDEYDPTVPHIIPAGPARWMLDGRLSVEDLEETIERPLPRGDYSTVGGLVLALAGRIPEEDDEVGQDGVTFTVVRMDRRRIARIRVDVSG